MGFTIARCNEGLDDGMVTYKAFLRVLILQVHCFAWYDWDHTTEKLTNIAKWKYNCSIGCGHWLCGCRCVFWSLKLGVELEYHRVPHLGPVLKIPVDWKFKSWGNIRVILYLSLTSSQVVRSLSSSVDNSLWACRLTVHGSTNFKRLQSKTAGKRWGGLSLNLMTWSLAAPS